MDVAADVILHWISSNIYTKALKDVCMKVTKIFEKSYTCQKGSSYVLKLQNFVKECEELFDIKYTDATRLKDQQDQWKVKQTDEDLESYKKQCLVPQVIISIQILIELVGVEVGQSVSLQFSRNCQISFFSDKDSVT